MFTITNEKEVQSVGCVCCLILAEWGQSQGGCSPSPEEIDANLDYINPPETAKWYVKGDGRVYTTAASILNSKAGRRHMENVRKIKLDNENDKE